MTTCKSVPYGKPDAGNPHVRFDEGEVAPAKPRRGSLLYKSFVLSCIIFLFVHHVLAAPLLLKSGRIDTSGSSQIAMVKLASSTTQSYSAATSKNVLSGTKFIIQCDDVITPEWRASLQNSGAKILSYIPENAYLISVTNGGASRVVAEVPHAILVPYTKTNRTAPSLLTVDKARLLQSNVRTSSCSSSGDIRTDVYVIALFSSDIRDEYVARINAIANCHVLKADGSVIRAALSSAGLAEVQTYDEVEYISLWQEPKLCNNVAVQDPRMNVECVWPSGDTKLGLTGKGQVIAIADGGLDTGNINTVHKDIRGRISRTYSLGRRATNDWSDPTGHGTHVVGSALGNGVCSTNSPKVRGVAYETSLVFQSLSASEWNSDSKEWKWTLGGTPADLSTLFQQAYGDESGESSARIHSNSWGTGRDENKDAWLGRYYGGAQKIDQFVFDHPDMLILFAAGNDGVDSNCDGIIDVDSINEEATAKNCLTVGASENYVPYEESYNHTWGNFFEYPVYPIYGDQLACPFDDTNQGMAAFSGRGPCDDGRIKPDIVAPGTDVLSLRRTDASDSENDYDQYYTIKDGTSMSTPLVAGSAALVRQWLAEKRNITSPDGATIKAMLLAGAKSLAPGQYGTGQYQEIPTAYPNNVEGWGQVNLGNTLVNENGLIVYDAQIICHGEEQKIPVNVSATGHGLTVVMAYADAPSALDAEKQLVDDLDLFVMSPSGKTYYPNSLSGPDRVNNVEGVRIPASEVEIGLYTIIVNGTSIPMPMDTSLTGGKGNAIRYSLVVSGAREGNETSTMYVEAKGGYESFGVSSNFNWCVTTDADWIKMPTSHYGAGIVNFTVAENCQWSERYGKIKMTSGSYTKTVIVIQRAREDLVLDFYSTIKGAVVTGVVTNEAGERILGRRDITTKDNISINGDIPTNTTVIVDYKYSFSTDPEFALTAQLYFNGVFVGECSSSGSFSIPTSLCQIKNKNSIEVRFNEYPNDDINQIYRLSGICTGTVTLCSRPCCIVKFCPGEIGEGEEISDNKAEGADLLLCAMSFKRKGYSLIGWSETDGDDVAQYGLFDFYKNDEPICLYPVWAPLEEDYETSETINGLKITKYLGDGGCVEVPKTIGGKTVVAIGESAFADCNTIVSLRIPEGVETIGDYAFNGCGRLQELSIPHSATNIGSSVAGQTCIKTLKVPSEVITVGRLNCSECLETVEIVEGSTNVANSFCTYSSITSIRIPSSVRTIGDSAFYSNKSLTSLQIPEGVMLIGRESFRRCSSLIDVTLPSSLISIGSNAFGECSSLETISVPSLTTWCSISFGDQSANPWQNERVLMINNCAVEGEIKIPSGVTSISRYAFINPVVTSIFIPNTVATIGEAAFNIERIEVSESNPYFKSDDGVLYDKNGLVLFCCPSVKREYSIPDGVTNISNSAFFWCSNLNSVRIPASVTTIAEDAFYGASGLRSVQIPECVTSISKTFPSAYKTITAVEISDGVTNIAKSLCAGCTKVTSVSFSTSVTNIGSQAFNQCSSLSEINLPDSVTSVEGYAFYGCSHLKKANLANASNVGEYAFSGCSMLEDITLAPGMTNLPACIFYNCEKLSGVDVPSGVISIGNSAFYGCNSLKEILLPTVVKQIGNSAFFGCRSLAAIKIPAMLEKIGSGAFGDCRGLSRVEVDSIDQWCIISFANESSNPLSYAHNLYVDGTLISDLKLPEGIVSINPYAFTGAGVASLSLPNGLCTIGAYAFSKCSRLTDFSPPSSVKTIENGAFNGCIGLRHLNIGNVDNISVSFAGCTNLSTLITSRVGYMQTCFANSKTSLEYVKIVGAGSISKGYLSGFSALREVLIGTKITKILANAFANCTSLQKVTIPSSVTSIGKTAFSGCSDKVVFFFEGAPISDIYYNAFDSGARGIYATSKATAWKNILGSSTGVWNRVAMQPQAILDMNDFSTCIGYATSNDAATAACFVSLTPPQGLPTSKRTRYQNLFKATIPRYDTKTQKWYIEMELDEDVKEGVVSEMDKTIKALSSEILPKISSTESPIINVVTEPGLWYNLTQGATIESMSGSPIMGTGESLSFEINKYNGSGFYTIKAGITSEDAK